VIVDKVCMVVRGWRTTPTLHPTGIGNSDVHCPVLKCLPTVGHFVPFIEAHWVWQLVVILVVLTFQLFLFHIIWHSHKEGSEVMHVRYNIVMLKQKIHYC